MSKIEIEVTDDNEFNAGWLGYVLGLDRPDVTEESSAGANGWDMGKDTPECQRVRYVFTRQQDIDHPQYIVRKVPTVGPRGAEKVKIVVGESDAG